MSNINPVNNLKLGIAESLVIDKNILQDKNVTECVQLLKDKSEWYKIKDKDDFKSFIDTYSKKDKVFFNIEITNDIEIDSSLEFQNLEINNNIFQCFIKEYHGNIEGNGHTLTFKNNSFNRMFGDLVNSTIKNLTIINCQISHRIKNCNFNKCKIIINNDKFSEIDGLYTNIAIKDSINSFNYCTGSYNYNSGYVKDFVGQSSTTAKTINYNYSYLYSSIFNGTENLNKINKNFNEFFIYNDELKYYLITNKINQEFIDSNSLFLNLNKKNNYFKFNNIDSIIYLYWELNNDNNYFYPYSKNLEYYYTKEILDKDSKDILFDLNEADNQLSIYSFIAPNLTQINFHSHYFSLTKKPDVLDSPGITSVPTKNTELAKIIAPKLNKVQCAVDSYYGMSMPTNEFVLLDCPELEEVENCFCSIKYLDEKSNINNIKIIKKSFINLINFNFPNATQVDIANMLDNSHIQYIYLPKAQKASIYYNDWSPLEEIDILSFSNNILPKFKGENLKKIVLRSSTLQALPTDKTSNKLIIFSKIPNNSTISIYVPTSLISSYKNSWGKILNIEFDENNLSSDSKLQFLPIEESENI